MLYESIALPTELRWQPNIYEALVNRTNCFTSLQSKHELKSARITSETLAICWRELETLDFIKLLLWICEGEGQAKITLVGCAGVQVGCAGSQRSVRRGRCFSTASKPASTTSGGVGSCYPKLPEVF